MGFGDDHLGTPYDSSFLLFHQLCGFSFSPIKRCNATVSHEMCELYNHHVIMYTFPEKKTHTQTIGIRKPQNWWPSDFLDSTCLRRFQDWGLPVSRSKWRKTPTRRWKKSATLGSGCWFFVFPWVGVVYTKSRMGCYVTTSHLRIKVVLPYA